MMLAGSPEAEAAALEPVFASRAARHDQDAGVSHENLALLHAAGLLTLAIPVQEGGQGLPLSRIAAIVGTIARGDPSTALILTMHTLMHASLARGGSWPEPVRRAVLRATVEDGALLNALRVEPELGTPARGGLPATTARRDGSGWRPSGRKIYSTGASVLRWGVVWARTDEPEPRVGGFLVPLASPGVSIEPSWNQLGMRATDSHTVLLDEVAIPFDHAVDIREPAGWAGSDPVQALWSTVLVAAVYDGVAQAARRWLLGFLRARVPSNLGQPLASLPRFHEQVGRIDALLLANRHLLAGVAAGDTTVDEAGGASAADGGLVKHLVTDNAIRAVELALTATGNHGLSRDNPLERHYRDVLCGRVHTPQSDAALALAGRLSLEG